jgi:hypothetical protein
MSVNCYNGRFVITAKSLETNVAVVTRVDCIFSSHEPQYHKAQIYTSASLYSAESILFNSWSLGVMRSHNRVKHFYICFNGESL